MLLTKHPFFSLQAQSSGWQKLISALLNSSNSQDREILWTTCGIRHYVSSITFDARIETVKIK